MVPEIQFALKKESMKCVEVGTIKGIGFSELDFAQHAGFDYGVNCLDECLFRSWRLARDLIGCVVGIWARSLAWVRDSVVGFGLCRCHRCGNRGCRYGLEVWVVGRVVVNSSCM